MPQGPLIEARIVDIDPERYLVKCVTETGEFPEVQYAVPYCHFELGQGVYFSPENEARCLLAFDTKGNPYIIGFIVPALDGYKANREDINPGDSVLKSKRGNKIIVRSSGLIEIEATPTSRLLISPEKDSFDFLFGRINMEGYNLGNFSWKEVDGDIEFQWSFKDNSVIGTDKVIIKIGNNAKIFEIKIFDNLGTEKAKLHCNDAGNWTMSGEKISLGNDSAFEPMVLGIKLLTYLASHTHPTPSGTSGPPSPPPKKEDFLSTIIYGK